MSALPEAESTARYKKNSTAYLKIEEPIWSLAYMASIAEDLAWKLLHDDHDEIKVSGERVTVTMTEFERGQLLYAVDKVSEMARALDKEYEGQ